MPTQAQITNRILRGQLLQLSISKSFANQEKVGNFFNFWDESVYVSNLVYGLQTQLGIADYTSTTTLNIYNKLGAILGAKFIDGASIDPNFQSNTINIEVVSVVAFNNDKIYFTDQSPVTLANYNTTYKQVYGNNPILAIYIPGYTEDEQTPPTITYQDDDPTKDILSITWDYPTPVSGYIQISGVSAVSGGTPAAGGGAAVDFTYDQTALVYDAATDQYYLPLLIPANKKPVYAEIDGISDSLSFNRNYTPTRLYGFANNATQTIVVTILTVA